jgi:D-methionine transport system ATP-binding protein
MPHHLIKISHLSKQFNLPSGQVHQALQDICLAIPQRCIYGIIGTSGAGKSTLLRCLAALDKPGAGQIIFDDQPLPYQQATALRHYRQQVGMVFQHFQLLSSRSVTGNIAYPLEIAGVTRLKQQERVQELLQLVGLETKGEHYPSQLSGGEKQRVGIARALAHHPKLLLCDEPTSALDTRTARSILQLLEDLNRQLGLTVVMITHQLEGVKQICERVAVLSQGQLVEEGETKQIFFSPQHPATKHLVKQGMDQIPSDWLTIKQNNRCLVRLGFEGHQAKQPVISQMIKRYAIDANILSGGLDYLQQTVVGHLFIELTGQPEEIEKALRFLKQQHISCEVIA